MDLDLSGVRHAFDEHCDCYYHEFGAAGVNTDSLGLLLWLNRLWNEHIEGDIMDRATLKRLTSAWRLCSLGCLPGLPTWKPTMTLRERVQGPITAHAAPAA